MRIGLTGGGATADRIVSQASRAEADGFTSMWYPSAAGAGDPLPVMALAGRATSVIELGTAVLQTYTCHPVLQASRANAVAAVIGAPGRFTLGVGPSHQGFVENRLGLSYDTPGQHTDEYAQILAGLLRGEHVSFAGRQYRVDAGPLPLLAGAEIPVLVGALGSRSWSGAWDPGCCGWPAPTRPGRSCGWRTPRRSRRTSPRPSGRPLLTRAGPHLASWRGCRWPCTTRPHPGPVPGRCYPAWRGAERVLVVGLSPEAGLCRAVAAGTDG